MKNGLPQPRPATETEDAGHTDTMPPDVGSTSCPLIGRAALLDDVTSLLRNERWITLVGSAGVGKTRLAHELRRRLSDDPTQRGDGTHVCELVDVASVAALADTIARALGLAIPDSDPASLGRALASVGRCLLILDGLDPTIALPERWLHDAPEARFLATAHRRLGLRHEVAVEVPPLELPPSDDLVDVDASPAVRLLAARAGQAWVEQDPHATASVARRLGGNPMAIELVAARARARTAVEVAAALGDDGVAPSCPLTRTLEWSWTILDPTARAALTRLSVFPNTFDAAAATAVCGPAFDLGALTTASLVRRFVEPRLGETRFALYPIVRAFVASQLPSAERAAAVRAHSVHYAALGAEATAVLACRHAPDAMLRRVLETPNLVAALERGPGAGEAAAAATCGLALEPDLTTQGRYEEALVLADRTVRAARDSGEPRLLARAMAMRGEVRRRRTLRAALADHTAAVAIAVDDPLTEARHRRCLGVAQRDLGAFVAAEASLVQAGALLRGVDAPREGAFVELALAALRRRTGEPDLGFAHAEAGRKMARDARDPLLEGRSLLMLALLHDDAGHLDHALILVEEALVLLRAQGDRWTEEIAFNAAGLLHAELGNSTDARACFEEALTICEDSGFGAGLACVTGNLGWLELANGRADRAALRFRQSITQARQVGYHFAEALYSASLGALEANRERVEEAAVAFHGASAAAASCPSPSLHLTLTVLRGTLDLARARYAAVAGDPARAAHELAQAHARLARGRENRRPDGDLRNAIRALERGIGDRVPQPPSSQVLRLIHAEHTAVLGAVRVPLARHRSLWRMLCCLARAIHPVSVEGLFAAGWPGERIGRRAARNRVHVGLSTLRKLGLSGILASSDEGYHLASHVTPCPDGADGSPVDPSHSTAQVAT